MKKFLSILLLLTALSQSIAQLQNENITENYETILRPSVCWDITVQSKKEAKKYYLKNVLGSATAGRMHAILGPSGSGKSTLLNSLAGVVPKDSMKLFGKISRFKENSEVIYIQQEDVLFPQLTTEETLFTSFALRTDLNSIDRNNTMENILNELGLKKVRNSQVGDTKTRGLSGGEKKRLSIGNEIIEYSVSHGNKSAFIYADEPTSGLDCYQAQKVMEIFKSLADQGNTVMFSIHQPRASIYELFDDITLLSEGSVMYSGPRVEMIPYFDSIGFPCPKNVNPAEYYLDLVSIDYQTPEDEQRTRDRISFLANQFIEKNRESHESIVRNMMEPSFTTSTSNEIQTQSSNTVWHSKISRHIKTIPNSIRRFWRTFQVLHTRAWRQIIRDRPLNIARLASSTFSALLFGTIYFKLGLTAATIPDRLGLLQVAAVNTAMLSLIKAATAFVTEKVIVNRERNKGAYGVLSYFLSKLWAEIPLSSLYPCLSGVLMYKLCGLNNAPGKLWKFLAVLITESIAATSLGMSIGSLVPTVESGVAIAPAVMVIFIVFGGLYVVNTPTYLSWVPKISMIKWAYEALCVNEFSGLELIPDKTIMFGSPAIGGPMSSGKIPPRWVKVPALPTVYPGENVLDRMGFGQATVGRALKAQWGIILFNYVFTIVSLLRQKPRYEIIQPNQSNPSNPASP